MIVIASLVLGTIAARLIGWLGPDNWDYVGSWPQAIAVGLAVMFLVPGPRFVAFAAT
jgi:hypothetical protein